jgi:hypothetical protein
MIPSDSADLHQESDDGLDYGPPPNTNAYNSAYNSAAGSGSGKSSAAGIIGYNRQELPSTNAYSCGSYSGSDGDPFDASRYYLPARVIPAQVRTAGSTPKYGRCPWVVASAVCWVITLATAAGLVYYVVRYRHNDRHGSKASAPTLSNCVCVTGARINGPPPCNATAAGRCSYAARCCPGKLNNVGCLTPLLKPLLFRHTVLECDSTPAPRDTFAVVTGAVLIAVIVALLLVMSATLTAIAARCDPHVPHRTNRVHLSP